MNENDSLTEQFEANRTHLRAVAYRMLGSVSEADDAVQEAWLRLSRSETSSIENLGGWLTTVVARVSPRHAALAQVAARGAAGPARARADREPRGRRRPRARGAAGRLGRPGAAGGARDAGSRRAARVRAARHVRHAVRRDRPARGPHPDRGTAAGEPRTQAGPGRGAVPDPDLERQREVVDAFLAASREGDFEALVAVLDPDVVLRADGGAVRAGLSKELRGARAVAEQAFQFRRLAKLARPALVNGAAGLVSAPEGKPFSVMGMTIAGGKIVEIDILADPERLSELGPDGARRLSVVVSPGWRRRLGHAARRVRGRPHLPAPARPAA